MPKIIVSDADGEREVGLNGDVTIGRVGENDIVIKVPEASRQHCRVSEEGGAWFVEDLGSSNGTRVNGRRVTKFELQDGDEIQVGIAKMRFLESDAVAPVPSDDDDLELEFEEISLEDEEEDVSLRFLNSGRADEVVKLKGRTTIGRKSANTIAMTEKGVSGTHAEVVREGGGWRVRDLGSTNGTTVNGEAVAEADLSPGDVLKVGIVQFVFGVDGNEGGDSVRSTVQVAEVALDDEVFAISEANFARKRKAASLLWLVFFAAVLGSAAFWVMQESGSTATSQEVVSVPGNCITTGASFEPSEDLEEYLTTDSDEVDFEEDTRYAHSGEHALRVDAAGSGAHYVSLLEEVQNISSSENLEIGGWFRTSSLNGVGGLSLTWLTTEGRELGRSFLGAPSGLSSFTEVRGAFHPPEGTERARLSLALHDAAGKVWVDDVFVLRRRGDKRVAMPVAGFDVMLDPSGALTVARDGRDVLAQGGLYWVDGDAMMPAFGWTTPSDVTRGDTRVSVAGDVSSDERASGSYGMTVAKNEVGVDIGARFGLASGATFGFVVRPEDGVVTVTADGATKHLESFSRDGVTELVLSTGPRAVRFAFEPPRLIKMNVTRRGDGLLAIEPGAADGGLGLDLPLQLDFEREREEVVALDQKAQEAELLQKRYGEAMVAYQEIVDRFSFRKDVADRAAAARARLQKRGDDLVVDLGRRVEDAIFFRTFASDYGTLTEELQGAIEAYRGVSIADRLTTIHDRLEKAHGATEGVRRAELADNHLARGIDLLTPGRSAPALARGFFLSVLELAPDSEAAQTAKEQLEHIRLLEGEKN